METKKFAIATDSNLFYLLDKDSIKQNSILFKPGPYWTNYAKRIKNEIVKSGLSNFRNNLNIGKGFADVISSDPFELIRNNYSLKEKIIRWFLSLPLIRSRIVKQYLNTSDSFLNAMMFFRSKYYSLLFEDFLKSLTSKLGYIDPLIGNPSNTIISNGNKIGLRYLNSALRLSSFSQKMDFENCHTYFEIGGGFGSTTDLILRMFPNIKKVIYLDIFPNLYIGTQFLKSIYGKAVKDYSNLLNVSEIKFEKDISSLEILAIPPWLLEKVKVNIDLFYNSESFQEMTPEIVNEYSIHINRLFGENKKRICLLFYEHFEVNNTISPDDVRLAFESNLDIHFNRFDPTYSLNDNSIWLYNNI